ncbi:MAG TPA: hypothetical protein VGQ65_19615 [Thermoanaerobaculia bacterium]|jgi:hypothetical protein|nr:hypothetical protein [Thermoanaerobaculia bacterium]
MKARIALLLCAFAAFGGHAFAQCPAGNAPVPSSPIGTNQNESTPITFSWSPSTTSGVTGYDVFATSGTANSTLICSVAGANANSCTGPAGGLSSGLYNWVVRANFANCTLQSATKQFTVNCPTGAPSIQSPSDGAQNVFTTATLTWSAVSGANQYDVYLGTAGSGACTGTRQFTTSNTSFNPSTLAPNTSYEWRVVAKKTAASTCPVTTSGCATFKTIAAACNPPGSFNLIAPSDKSATSSTPTLTWSASSGADKYLLHISTQNPPPPTSSDPVVNSNTTSFTFSQALPAGTYYWSVDAYPPNCTTAKTSSNVFSFTVAAPVACPTAPPALSKPANNSTVDTPVSFDWSDVSGATFYKVFTSINGAAASVLAVTRESNYEGSLPAGASVDWWVEAGGDNCNPVASAHSHFNVISAGVCPSNPQSTTQIAPANGSTGLTSPVRFEWTSVPGATNYVVWGLTAGSTSSTERFVLGKFGGTHITVPVPQGSVAWYVESQFGDCPTSTYSKVFTLTVATPSACSSNATTLLSPVNGATGLTSPVTFQWTPVSGATGYKLYIAQGDDSGDLAGSTTSTTLTTLVPSGSVTWWVATTFAGCPDVVSPKSTFTSGTQATCGTTATLNSPADGATITSPVTLSWSAVTGASGYRLWISVNGSSPILAARSLTASATSQQLQLPSGADEWYVETLFANGCDSTFSAHRRFTVSAAANCDTHKAATLTSPIGGAQASNPITFNWSATDSSAFQYRVWVSLNGEPFADIGYTKDTKLQHDFGTATGSGQWFVETLFENCPAVVSARAAFVIPSAGCATAGPQIVSPLEGTTMTAPVAFVWSAVANATEYRLHWTLNGNDMDVLKTTATSISHLVPPGAVEWRVDAIFDGCPTTRSVKSHFTVLPAQTCVTDAPVLTAPADGAANLDSPVHFDWNPVSNAVGYLVVIRSKDSSPTELAETTTRTGVTKAVSEGQNEWWVVAFFNGCPPAESKHQFFTVTETNCDDIRPILFAPAEDASGLASPVHFEWSHVKNATEYKVWASVDDDDESVIGTTTVNKLTIGVPGGTIRWHVQAFFQSCPALDSATSTFTVRTAPPPCATSTRPVATAPAQVASGSVYNVRWNAVPNATSYELQESSLTDFSSATTQVVSDVSAAFTHTAATAAQKWLYRVRAISSCNDERGAYSRVVIVTVIPETPQKQTSVEAGSLSAVRQNIFIPGRTPAVPFTARTDKPWAAVTPASGTLGPAGVTLTIVSDPTALKLGTNTATLILTIGASAKVGAEDTPPVSVPVSVTTVTPVAPQGKNTPLPNSLIIPAVGHAVGIGDSLFESDVRIANTSAQAMKYQLNFTLTHTDATQSGQSTTIQVDPGATMALDDILTSFFGTGSDGATALGVLEIRPLTSTQSNFSGPVSIQTVASSRTYNTTPTGTFGQYIPAIAFSQFIGQAPDGAAKAILSLQQIAQSTAYRTNFGIVEGAGEPASVLVHIFNNAGVEVAPAIPISLMPGEHQQRNLLAENGITLTDGRFEVEVVSATGKVTAYASVIDNLTNDPLMIFPVLKGAESATRYVVPGVGDINNGFASWRSDIRFFNPATTSVTATLTYFPQPGSPAASSTKQITIPAGQVFPVDSALQQLFALTNSLGSLLVTTPSSSKLTVTARTYNQTSNGTYGQFIPAVTPAGSVGLSDNRVLQLLQLESSDKMRTNLGFVETNGSPVTIEITAIPPDSKVAPKTQITLAANQFLQLNDALKSFGLGTVYNARVTVKVLSGTGRVTSYASVVDAATQDPTYVPAQ